MGLFACPRVKTWNALYNRFEKKLDAMLAFTRANIEKSRCSKTRKGDDWGRGMDIVTRGYKFQNVNLIMIFYI